MRFFTIIILFLSIQTCFGQKRAFEPKCSKIHVWSRNERDFSKKINKLFKEGKKNDSVVALIYQGGVGWQVHTALVCSKKNNSYEIHFFSRQDNLSALKETIITKEDEEKIIAFFNKKLYLTKDTIPTNYLSVDDGSSTQIVYKVGEYCGTFRFMPYIFKGELINWSYDIVWINAD